MKLFWSGRRIRLDLLEGQIALLHSKLESLQSDPKLVLDPNFFIAFEDRFRGPFDEIKQRVAVYIDDFAHLIDSNKFVVDIGCGRGELLTVLKESGINAIGVDSNPLSITSLIDRGFEAYCEDLSYFLKRTPNSSIAAITMLHVVEHLPFDLLLKTFNEIYRVLEPGGILIVETPNSLNLLVGASTFWIDPTHQRPLHPELLRFVAETSKFNHNEIRQLQINRSSDPTDTNDELNLIRAMVFGSYDIALKSIKA